NQVVDKSKIAKLMGLNKHAEVMCCVDSAKNINDLSEAAQAYGVELGVLVEVNVGLNRCGVETPEEAVELAKLVSKSKGLKFMGMQGYEGHLVNIADFGERKAAIEKDLARLGKARDAIEKAGMKVGVADSAGSGSYNITGELPFVDEVQAGSYIFMDTNYMKVLKEFKPALTLLTTIISRPTKERAITNAGMKALSNDEGAIPAPMGMTGAELEELHEEHGVLKLHNPSRELNIGDKIDLILGHVCTTVNLHDRYYGVRNGKVEVIWPITGRGKFR
ncbi:MAG: alanine racemase, partial [Chloroflexi bacterium]|nr:alanine racemase [Chloroflexota bacterium]